MNGRSHHFQFSDEREPERVMLWNGGLPFIIDGRTRRFQTFDVDPEIPKQDLLDWAEQNGVRCVGFDGDSRPRFRSVQRRQNTWAVE